MHEALTIEPEVFHERYWARRHDYDRNTLNGEAYWREIAAVPGKPPLTAAQLDTLYAADVDLWTDINQPMLHWAQSLRARGLKIGILSNMGDRMVEGLLRKLSWLGEFDHHTWSHALGVAKPEPAIYQHAARGLATPSPEILFIDDKPENIAAARAADMHAVQYTNWSEFLVAMQAAGYSHLISAENAGGQRKALASQFS